MEQLELQLIEILLLEMLMVNYRAHLLIDVHHSLIVLLPLILLAILVRKVNHVLNFLSKGLDQLWVSIEILVQLRYIYVILGHMLV